MTAIELYKFIHENGIEFRWQENGKSNDVLIWVSTYQIDDFNNLLVKSSIMSEGGIECGMLPGSFWFWMADICGYFGIELEEIFGKDPTPTE